MKIYVASSLKNAERVKEIYQLLEESGHEITYDWTTHGLVTDRRILDTIAANEYNGIRQADCLLFVHPGRTGSHIELGIALGLKKNIIMFWDNKDEVEYKSFYSLGSIRHVEDWEGVMTEIESIDNLNSALCWDIDIINS